MKINLSNILGGFNLSAINDRFKKIETEFNDKVLYRDNPTGEPNQMENDLDMNGHRLLNVSGIDIGDTIDIPKPATELPKPIGLYPAVGVSNKYAREDHVHVGLQGSPGQDGAPGKSNALIYCYKRSAEQPLDTPGNITYDFWTAQITEPAGELANGWKRTVPDGTVQLWVVACSASSDERTDTIQASEWTTPVKFAANGADGANGINAATIYIYKRTPTAAPPFVPSVGVTYTFAPPTVSGLNNGWTTTIPDIVYGDYLWVSTATAASTTNTDNILPTEWAVPQIMGRKGDAGKDGANGGLSNTVIHAYKRAAEQPTDTPGNVTYNFAQGAITVPDFLANGWEKTIPAGTNPLWVVSASASGYNATDDINATEWSTPVKLAQNGIDGLNSATLYIYQRATTNTVPALPTTTASYNFNTKTLSNVNNGWSTSVPSATNGDYLFVSTATASSTTLTDDILPTEWAAATLFAQSGIPGVATATLYAYKRATSTPVDTPGAVTWTFASAQITNPPGDSLANGWTKSVPSGTNPLYVTVATASGTGATDTVAANEWSTPVIMAKDGSGINVATVYIYQRNNSASAPVLPSSSANWTFSTGALTGLNNGWSHVMPSASGGSYLWVSTATASSTTDTDTILSTEWAAAQIMAKDGTNGTNGTSGSDGKRGTVTLAQATTASYWSNSEANSAISSSGYYPPQNRDIVTLYNTSANFSETRFYDNGSWLVLNAYINGNMLVDGTLSATKVTGGTLSGASVQVQNSSGSNWVFKADVGSDTVQYYKMYGSNITAGSLADPASPAISGTGNGDVGVYGLGGFSLGSHGVRGVGRYSGATVSSGLVGANNGKALYAEIGNIGPFTGVHDVAVKNEITITPGDIVVDDECLLRNGLSNTLFSVKPSVSVNQKGAVGVYTRTVSPMNTIGVLAALSPENQNEYFEFKDDYMLGEINALGEGQINVCGLGGNIEKGDFITTSSIPGKGMKQSDDLHHTYTVARSREAVTFTNPNEQKTIACIYLCG